MGDEKNHLNRREFLSKSVYGILTAGLLGISGDRPTEARAESIQEQEKTAIYRTLGRTKIHLPVVSMGVMNAFEPALVKKSYEIGVRHFDTAAYYQRGRNEEMVGNAIRELGVRDKVHIGTKVFIPHEQRGMSDDRIRDFFLGSAEDSLTRLKTDYIDILYVHNVKDTQYLNNPGIKEAMLELKDQKKIHFIGFSTHANMAECIQNAAENGFYDVIATAFNYSMEGDKGLLKALQNASSKGIGIIAMKTQCAQYWYREYVPEDKLQYYKGSILHRAVLKWVLQHDFITTAIPGYTTFQQMEEDVSVAYNIEYSDKERKFLDDRNVKEILKSYCLQCSGCMPSCPNQVDIPTLMRTHMYAFCYAKANQAHDTLLEIPKGKGLDACISCGSCQAKCVGKVDIYKRICDLKRIEFKGHDSESFTGLTIPSLSGISSHSNKHRLC